ncbi:DUF6804 family protein [Humibacter albus]|uniref:DUF6804 family protein n=1 Tax=Humibacter albus TaxID=427754 RepID=UPI0003B3E054|nr:DUF6804 family protein [Humibacter albus]
MSSSKNSASKSSDSRVRLAFLPGVLGAIILMAALALVGGDWYIWVRFAVAILALIMCVFAVQAKAYWWLIGLVPLAIAFNPVWPLPIGDLWLRLLHLAGAIVFIAAGVAIKVPVPEQQSGPAGRYDGKRRPSGGSASRGRASGRGTSTRGK